MEKNLLVRMSEAEHARIKKEAWRARLSISDLVRVRLGLAKRTQYPVDLAPVKAAT